jgi:hypothetical protein
VSVLTGVFFEICPAILPGIGQAKNDLNRR